MRKRVILGIIFLLLTISIIIFFLWNKGIIRDETCNSRNPENCDRTCQVDSDCKFTCGCGVINKNENCNLKDSILCELPPREFIQCTNNKCILDINQQVRIFTDKTSYNQGENVNITIQTSKTIYKAYPGLKIKILEGEDWNTYEISCYNDKICDEGRLKMLLLAQLAPLRARRLNEEKSTIWKQEYCIYENKTCGEYKYTGGTTRNLTVGKDTLQLKAEFCYWEEEDVDFSSYDINGEESKKKCIETSFNITP